MSDRNATTKDTGAPQGEPSNEAERAPSVGEMCRGFAEMRRRMMAGEMPECCRPEAQEKSDKTEADETSSGEATT